MGRPSFNRVSTRITGVSTTKLTTMTGIKKSTSKIAKRPELLGLMGCTAFSSRSWNSSAMPIVGRNSGDTTVVATPITGSTCAPRAATPALIVPLRGRRPRSNTGYVTGLCGATRSRANGNTAHWQTMLRRADRERARRAVSKQQQERRFDAFHFDKNIVVKSTFAELLWIPFSGGVGYEWVTCIGVWGYAASWPQEA